MVRQGDVLLVRARVPAAAKQLGHQVVVILALGEATGHSHTIIGTPGLKVFEHEGTRWIRVPKRGVKLVHQEHGDVAVAGGEYRVVLQREYSPEAIRNVRD